jgi:hypothetical protein
MGRRPEYTGDGGAPRGGSGKDRERVAREGVISKAEGIRCYEFEFEDTTYTTSG